ncbi:MAG: hypothetical protein JWQ25_2376 [Daejeonella sp.]|nr:hypothetical protein [Daejeonella sp.]
MKINEELSVLFWLFKAKKTKGWNDSYLCTDYRQWST